MTNPLTFKQNFIHFLPVIAGPARLLSNPLIAAAAGAAFGALVTTLVFKNHTRPSAIIPSHFSKIAKTKNKQSTEVQIILDRWMAKSDGAQEISRKKAAEIILECYKNKQNCLDLSNLGLSTLPDVFEIFGDTLTSLHLNGNELKNIPDSIAHLKNLQILKLNNNPISSLPCTIGQLQNLRQLSLINTPFLYSLPLSIKDMPNLYCQWNLDEPNSLLTEYRESWLEIAQNVLVHGPDYSIYTIGKELRSSGVTPYLNRFPSPLIPQKSTKPAENATIHNPSKTNKYYTETYYD